MALRSTPWSWLRRQWAGSGGVPLAQPKTFVRFDGVNQYMRASGALPLALYPGGPGPSADYTVLFWVRGTDAAESASVMRYHSVICTGEANDAASLNLFRPIAQPAQMRIIGQRLRTTPSVTFVQRLYYQTSWPSGTMATPDAWRLMAQVVSTTTYQMYARGALQPNSTASATASYNNAAGTMFTLNAYTDAAGTLSAGTTMPLDYRAPAVYLRTLSEAELQALDAAGPTVDQSTAEGWWPGDGDTYPTLTNLGTVGSAWNLTLLNGSQAMIMEE